MRNGAVIVSLLVGATLQALSIGSATARSGGAMPAFDIKRSCNDAKAIGASSERTDDYRSCLKDEHRARAQIARTWSTYTADARRSCAPEGPDPSYVEMLTCLQMSTGAGPSSDVGGPVAPGLQFK